MQINIIGAMAVVTMATTVSARLLGACYDDHKCVTCAGYTWCDSLAKCVRMWEGECDDPKEV